LVAATIKLDLANCDYMTSDWPWKYLWVIMLNDINAIKFSSAKSSIVAAKGSDTKRENVISQDWERGVDFKDHGADCPEQ